MYPRKLSVLTSEKLDIEIQQKSDHEVPPPLTEEDNTGAGNSIKNASMVGHSSVEDGAAALRLYWHEYSKWERSLGYPFRLDSEEHQMTQSWSPLKMYLDGCNLPIGMRGVNFKELMATPNASDKENGDKNDDENDVTIIPSSSFRLTSRKRDSNHSSNISTIDWMPQFQSAISPQSAPKLDSITIMWDGAKFSTNSNGGKVGRKAIDTYKTREFLLDFNNAESEPSGGPIRIEITEVGESADDVLFHKCTNNVNETDAPSGSLGRIISLDKAIDMLSSQRDFSDSDILSEYIVIRRKAGGSKTHRKLFDKLNLRRPTEGALCLCGLTAGLQKEGWRTARELQREKSIEKVIECEVRRRDEIKYLVVTDDIFLTDRLVQNGVLVLSFRQLTNMF